MDMYIQAIDDVNKESLDMRPPKLGDIVNDGKIKFLIKKAYISK